MAPEGILTCRDCGTELAPGLLACPSCHRLLHADALKAHAAEAERAEASGDLTAALTAWRQALPLLPPGTRQQEGVLLRIQGLSGKVEQAPVRSGLLKGVTGVGALGVLGLLLGKGKFLLLGLTKLSTLFTMLLSMGVYWAAWGWTFAVGLVLSIYIHEMGHVAMLRRYGIPASAPMFIPGLGAVIRSSQYPATPREDSRVGLAGPLWGLGAAVLAWAVFAAGGGAYWGALAKVGAWINLFNLLPLWQLDGGRGFRSLTRGQRLLVCAALGAAWVLTKEGLLVLILLAAIVRVFEKEIPREGDPPGLLQYLLLLGSLSALSTLQVPVPGGG